VAAMNNHRAAAVIALIAALWALCLLFRPRR
jgi:hypothetical protein